MRNPRVKIITEEIEWYSAEEAILGVILLDFIDSDFSAVVMARDENYRFRAIDSASSFSPIEDARQ